jgi:O-antigen/teichoic acid export membrane protein
MTNLKISGGLLARNTLLNFTGQAIPLLVKIGTMPFIVHGLGTERFGLLSLAWVILGYFTIFDLGLGPATAKHVAEALGKGAKDQVPRLIWTAVTVQAAFGVIGALALGVIAPLLVEDILSMPLLLTAEAKIAFYWLAASIPAVLISGSLTGALAAAQRFDLVNAVGASFSVANSLLTLVGVLFWDWRLPEIISMLVVSRLLALVVYYWLCLRVFPAFKGPPCFHWAELWMLVGFGGWVTVSSVIGPILVYLDRFMIGALLSMAAVAYYAAPYEMVTRLWIVPTSLGVALFPAFSTLIGRGQQERLLALLSRSVKWVLLTLGPTVIIVITLARDILQLWLGSAFAAESTLILQILAVGVLVNSLAHVPYSLIHALGRPDLTAKFHLAELPLHVLLAWWLIGRWGAPGAALAWSIRVAVDALLLFIAACRLASVPSHPFVFDSAPQIGLSLCLFAGIVMGISSLPLEMWLRLLGLGIILLPVGVLVWHYVLDAEERHQIVGLVRLVSVR